MGQYKTRDNVWNRSSFNATNRQLFCKERSDRTNEIIKLAVRVWTPGMRSMRLMLLWTAIGLVERYRKQGVSLECVV